MRWTSGDAVIDVAVSDESSRADRASSAEQRWGRVAVYDATTSEHRQMRYSLNVASQTKLEAPWCSQPATAMHAPNTVQR